ncbi:hypothetical protein ACFL4Y_04375, partial [Gemmatimonadota bacterium]
MPTAFVLSSIVFLVVIAVAIFVVVHRKSKARRQALARQAMMFGFTYAEEAPADDLEGLSLHLFEQGHSRKVTNAMSGRYRGSDLRAFDYHYTTGSG